MSDLAIILIAISQVIVLLYLYIRNKRVAAKNKNAVTEQFPYESMRTMALNTSPGALLLSMPENEIGVYAIVIDWNMGDDTVTLYANLSGDASIYVKSGGGVIGGGMHKNVVLAANQLVSLAQQYISKATPVSATPMPDKNSVLFYLLTNKGKYAIHEYAARLENHASEMALLFDEGQMVMAALHHTTQPKS